MAEIMSCLFFRVMKYKLSEPRDKSSDRFILSKGHAAPILYAAWAEAGLFPVEDLMNLRKLDSDLEGMYLSLFLWISCNLYIIYRTPYSPSQLC